MTAAQPRAPGRSPQYVWWLRFAANRLQRVSAFNFQHVSCRELRPPDIVESVQLNEQLGRRLSQGHLNRCFVVLLQKRNEGQRSESLVTFNS